MLYYDIYCKCSLKKENGLYKISVFYPDLLYGSYLVCQGNRKIIITVEMEYARSVCCKQVIGSRMNGGWINVEYITNDLWQKKWVNFVMYSGWVKIKHMKEKWTS